MFIVLGIVVILVALLLILIVIIQNPKGGMMSSSIGSVGNQLLGASKSTDTVEKITWGLAGTLMALSIASIFLLPDGKEVLESSSSEGASIKEVLDRNKNTTPTLPPSAPVMNQPAAPNTAPANPPAQTPPPAGK